MWQRLPRFEGVVVTTTLLALVCGMFRGGGAACIKQATTHHGSLFVSILALVLLAATYILVGSAGILFTGKLKQTALKRSEMKLLAVWGALSAFCLVMYVMTYQCDPAPPLSYPEIMIRAITALFVPILSGRYDQGKPNGYQWIAIGLSIAAAWCMGSSHVTEQSESLSLRSVWVIPCILCALSVSYCIVWWNIFGSNRELNSPTKLFWGGVSLMLFGLPALIIMWAHGSGSGAPSLSVFSAGLVGYAVFGTIGQMFGIEAIQRGMPPYTREMVTSITLLMTVLLLGPMAFGEPLTVRACFGMFLAIVAVALQGIKRREGNS